MKIEDLTTESVESASLPLQSVHDVHGSDSLSLGVFCVGDGVTDYVLQEDLQNSASLLVNQTRDSFHTTSAGQTADSGLGDSLDVVTQDLPVALGTSLSKTFSSFSSSGHDFV